MSIENERDLDAHLRRFFVEMASVKEEKDRNEEDASAFLFHIKECVDDMKALCAMTDEPSKFNEEEVNRIMQGVIYHALPHLIAAARLYDYVPDILK